jgi:hypothetical protein
MNGRIYDPLIGRFMSADPFIQSPENLQSHNRYAYVLNNPLTLTDPSGYFSLKKLFRAALAIGVGYFTGQWIGNSFITSASTGYAAGANGLSTALVTLGGEAGTLTGLGSALASAGGGFMSGLVGSGNLSGALHGAFSGSLFGAAGSVGGDASLERMIAHGAAGCLSGAAGGGGCGSGAVSAMFGKFATNAASGLENNVARGVVAVVSGGVGSVIAGGKFENGAVTAAFGYLFNYCAHATTKCFGAWAQNLGKIALGGLGMFGGGALCTTGVGCALGSVGVIAGGANVYEGADWVFNRDESTDGVNPIKRAITSAVPSANADLAFASMEVLGGRLALKAPIILKDELWFRIYGIQRVPGLPITVPASSLPQGAFDAAGAAWDGANAAIDQTKKKRP